jgi:hypothetical protein
MISRRFFLAGAAAVAAPAIIRPGILMPVKRILMPVKRILMPVKRILMPVKRILMPVKRILMPDDGIALQSIAHPSNYLGEVAPNLTEESLLKLMLEVFDSRAFTAQPKFFVVPPR